MKLHLFELARLASLKSSYKYKVGACLIVGKSRYIGINKGTKTHSQSNKAWKTICAEFDAIIKAKRNNESLNNAEIYVYRTMRKGGQGLAKPCQWCFELIKKVGIKQIYYSTEEGCSGIKL